MPCRTPTRIELERRKIARPAVLRRSEQRRYSSASDDAVCGIMRAMREQLNSA
jgi:hypothetical protein